ncbi:hypothetical protein CO046_05085 [Candidatus Peregrinibacteria bacterium CG_4_9_14_0_2_um_filter_53_11]|nr:MAG: hypothetical protein CO046_05085 [Candidatus Peregrinibacteria bacterium CG_4_9_14_0_2_um_filter_53_11]
MVAQGKTLQEVERVLRGEGDESDERAARGVRRQESCRVALADATAEMFGFDDVYGGAWGSLAALSADSQLRTALLNDTSALLGATADRRYLTDLPVGEAASPSDQPPTMSIPFSGIVRHMLPDWIRPTTPDELNKAAAYPLANAALVAQILAEGGAVVYPGNSRKISPFGDSGILKMDSHSWVRAGLVCAMEDGVIKGDSERAAQHFQVVDRLAGHAFRQDGGVERVDPYYQLRGHLNTVPGYNAGGWTVDHMTDPQTRGLRTNGPVEVMIDAMGTVRRFLRANSNVKNVRKEVCKGLKISAAERDGLFDWACDNGADPLPPNFYPPQLGGLVNTVGGLVHERAVERRAAAGRALPFFPVLKGLVKPAAEGDPVL